MAIARTVGLFFALPGADLLLLHSFIPLLYIFRVAGDAGKGDSGSGRGRGGSLHAVLSCLCHNFVECQSRARWACFLP